MAGCWDDGARVITGCWEHAGVMAGCWECGCVIAEGGGAAVAGCCEDGMLTNS